MVAPPPSDAEWITVQEVADVMRCSKMTVFRLIHAGSLPAYQFGRSMRIKRADFDRIIEGFRVEPERTA